MQLHERGRAALHRPSLVRCARRWDVLTRQLYRAPTHGPLSCSTGRSLTVSALAHDLLRSLQIARHPGGRLLRRQSRRLVDPHLDQPERLRRRAARPLLRLPLRDVRPTLEASLTSQRRRLRVHPDPRSLRIQQLPGSVAACLPARYAEHHRPGMLSTVVTSG